MAATTWIPAPTSPAHGAGRAVGLRAVPTPGRGRRAVGLLVAAVALTALAAPVVGGVLGGDPSSAGPSTPVGVDHVVVAPGEALWDVAVRSAGPGVDPRAQFRDLVLVNGLAPSAAPAPWTILTLPAR
jgi:hypothetical protein